MSNISAGGKLDFTIPKNIAPGDYLLRAEAIALHAAGPAGGAQHYMTCYQLTVTGSGTLEPKGVTFPEAYSKTGPGLGFSAPHFRRARWCPCRHRYRWCR